MSSESRKVALAKTITWRVIASLTTFFVAWAYTGELDAGILIGSTEAVAKMFLYYGHERAWVYALKRGIPGLNGAPRRQAAAKTISWRFIASFTTFLIAFAVTGEFGKSFAIGLTEAFLKMIFYYLHERAWKSALDQRAQKKAEASS